MRSQFINSMGKDVTFGSQLIVDLKLFFFLFFFIFSVLATFFSSKIRPLSCFNSFFSSPRWLLPCLFRFLPLKSYIALLNFWATSAWKATEVYGRTPVCSLTTLAIMPLLRLHASKRFKNMEIVRTEKHYSFK